MLIETLKFKNLANKILAAMDSSAYSEYTEMLELKIVGTDLCVSITNKEYYAQVRLPLNHEEQLHATVNATQFLKLIAQITSEDINLEVKDQYLICTANGTYKLPLIFEGEKLLELPVIDIANPTCQMSIETEILKSILRYNSRELAKGTISRPVQKFYYVDELGAITFTSGACVNSFSLEKPVKLLLSGKVVKLFKLFSDDATKFTLGYDAVSEEIIQTKVKFESSDIVLTAILPGDDNMLNSVPVKLIRDRAETIHPYSVTASKDGLLQAINRLLIFSKKTITQASVFEFDADKVTIRDKDNSEVMSYANHCAELEQQNYSCHLDMNDFKATLEACTDQYITLSFGDREALILARANVKVVIPECSE